LNSWKGKRCRVWLFYGISKMLKLEQIKEISIKTDSKIVMLIMDGLGGLQDPATGKTELETAKKPNMDKLAKSGICGMSVPVSMGITPGSGPGHLALFGYNPAEYIIGRGILEALGINFQIQQGDIAARGNFCTVDSAGKITDRRAGRISTDTCAELCAALRQIKVNKAELFFEPVREHRFLMVIRGKQLSQEVTETDPQKVGVVPMACIAREKNAAATALIVNTIIEKASKVLADKHPANMMVLRGFASKPEIPLFDDVYKLNPAAIARYPMYKGLARLVGMKIYDVDGETKDEIKMLEQHWGDHDFFFVHVKETDSSGEDGDFQRKVKAIENFDSLLPDVLKQKPDVVIITGDHSTPAVLKGHSWHPIPCLVYSPYCRFDKVEEFTESACIQGGLGNFSATDIMPLAMANALKLTKFGA
jgi:2,3-bisphosphoglycerate-independent phosphoglycerate mutase